MLEFISHPYPPIAPQACVCCGGATGPVVDTHRELHGHGRVYVCVSCWERAGRALGTLKGKQRNDLLGNQRQIAQLQTDVEQLHRQVRAAEADRDDYKGRWERQATKLADARQRVEQLETRLADEARAALELVGVGADLSAGQVEEDGGRVD